MKLFYSAGSCSTSCHITLEESGLRYEAVAVDWDNPSDPNISEVTRLNSLGTLPIFITEEGKQLDQNLAIHTYVADRAKGKNLLAPVGTVERAEAMNWLAFVSSDLHKTFSILFALEQISPEKQIQTQVRRYAVGRLNEYFEYLDTKLKGGDYLCGSTFTPADAYGFVVSGWSKWLEIPLTKYKNLEAWRGRVAQRPAVQRVFKMEGLE